MLPIVIASKWHVRQTINIRLVGAKEHLRNVNGITVTFRLPKVASRGLAGYVFSVILDAYRNRVLPLTLAGYLLIDIIPMFACTDLCTLFCLFPAPLFVPFLSRERAR